MKKLFKNQEDKSLKRIGIFFKLKDNKAEEYKKAHDEIWIEMRSVLQSAGIKNYSIWRENNMLFAYYEIEDEKITEKILLESEIYQKWRKKMEGYIYSDPVTGQKEWFMEMVFFQE